MAIVTKKLKRVVGGTTTTVTTREYVPKPIPEGPPERIDSPPTSGSVLPVWAIATALIAGLVIALIRGFSMRRTQMKVFISTLLLVAVIGLGVLGGCGVSVDSDTVTATDPAGEIYHAGFGPPTSNFEPIRKVSENRSQADVDDVRLAITHNYADPNPDPLNVKGLELRVTDDIGTVHRGIIWPWYDWIPRRSNQYYMADLGSDIYVFRIGKTPDFNNGDYTYYFHLDASPGGSGAWVPKTHNCVGIANAQKLWRLQYASIDPDPSTVVWPNVVSETVIVDPFN